MASRLKKKPRIAVVTTTRAEYGLLYWLIRDLKADPGVDLRLLVTGTHLSPEFGRTVSDIERDGFPIAERIEMMLSSDSNLGAAKSIGVGMLGFADALARQQPDMIVVLGDRFELLAVCSAAVTLRIPIVHIHGGETTEGVIDEQVRHAITKMAHLHFVTTETYRKNVIQMGENPKRIFHFGAPGLDHLRRTRLLGRGELEKKLGFRLGRPTLLVTCHPETLRKTSPADQVRALFKAIERSGARAVFTYANADPGGRTINAMISEFAGTSERYFAVPSVGHADYLSLLRHADAVVGNSSSGIIEAPSFKKPTVNIGERQKGRVRAASVIDCGWTAASIEAALRKALSPAFVKSRCTGMNPYENGGFSKNAVRLIKKAAGEKDLLAKSFRKLRA